jgi:cob(I)alamin adenosyltransferase
MAIYTKKGDFGTTSLINQRDVSKDALELVCIGTIDELNSSLGLVCAFTKPNGETLKISEIVNELQKILLTIGSVLAGSNLKIEPTYVTTMEQIIDHYESQLPDIKNFILPGGSPSASHCHHARTICRRVERLLVSLALQKDIDPEIIRIFNRLSDLLFVLARALNHFDKVPEQKWVTQQSED